MAGAVDRIERLLGECPRGEVWAVVGYASAAGLRWLGERTAGRPIRLLIGDTRTGFAKGSVSADDRAAAIRFINRPDVQVTNWYRRKGGYRTVHAKAWAVMPDGAHGRPAGVVVGSANLTMQGLHHNTELVAQVVGDEAERVVREMEAVLDESWDAKANLLRRLEGSPQAKSQASRRRSSPSGHTSHRTAAHARSSNIAIPPHTELAGQAPDPRSHDRGPLAAGSANTQRPHVAGPALSDAADWPRSRPVYAPRELEGIQVNRAAKAAFIFGVAALFSLGLTAPIGVVAGHLGRNRAKRLAGKGRRLAMTGLICGYLGLPAFAGVWLLPLFSGA